MKKVLKLFVVALFLVTTQAVHGVTNGSDEIQILNPIQRETISGQYSVNWRMNDNDQDKISYQVDLFLGSCELSTTLFGVVEQGVVDVNQSKQYSIIWNSNGAIKNKSDIVDGTYCFRVCAVFIKSGSNFYGLCDKRTVDVFNGGNRPPKITSTPENLNIDVGSAFSYNIQASDADGDKITYSLVESPQFLSIDANSGVMTNNSKTMEEGSYQVTVKVTDGKGGADSQSFTLNMGTSSVEQEITVLFPKKGEVVSNTKNTILWKINSVEQVKSLEMQYSSDYTIWNSLEKFESPEEEYIWDVSELESGEYALRFIITHNDGTQTQQTSEEFFVNPSDVPEEITVISELSPKEEAVLYDSKPEISAKFNTPGDGEIDREKISIWLDDIEEAQSLSCEMTDDKIVCLPSEELKDGRHKVKIEVKEESGNTSTKEWFFEVNSENTSDGEGVIIFGREIPRNTLLLACGLSLICLALLGIPWIGYYRTNRKTKKLAEDENEFENIGAVEVNEVGKQLLPKPVKRKDTKSLGTKQINVTENTYQVPSEVSKFQGEIHHDQVKSEIGGDPTSQYIKDTVIEPMIGTQTVGEDARPELIPDVQGTESALGGQSEEYVMPSSYTNDEIPSWLKDFEEGQAVGKTQGDSDIDLSADNSAAAAKVHDEHGLALNPEGDK